MYSTNNSSSCFLVFIILTRDYVNYRYGYVDCIGPCAYLSITYVSFKGWSIIMSYSVLSLIQFVIWLGQNYLNIIAYAFFTFSSSLFSLSIWFSIFIFCIVFKDSFSDSALIGSYYVDILLIVISLLKSKTISLRIDSTIPLTIKNLLWMFKIVCFFTLVNVSICQYGPVPRG